MRMGATQFPQIFCEYTSLENLDDLKPHPKNRNKHSDAQIERLSKLFQYHGIRHPIIVSAQTGYIVAGHGRLAAARLLKMKEFPAVFQDFASTEQEYAFLVADNAIAEWSSLDLAGINVDVGELGPDFDLEQLGLKNFTVDVADKPKTEYPLCGSCGQKVKNA